jgi:propionyl-CoA synthetase
MLACARLGAIHSVVFGGFASSELAVRIDDCNAKAIIAGSCGLEPGRIVPYKPLLDEAISLAEHKPDFCIVYQREELRADLIEGRDFDWNDLVSEADEADCVPVRGEDPLYILYTSGTTGQPKGVIRPVGGHLVSLNWTMKNFYDIHPGEVFWAASDVGWVVGHSYIVYAPLVSGTTSVLFEGKPVGTPDAGTFWRVISDHNVVSLFTAPTAFRAIKRADPKGNLLKKYSLTSLRTLFLAGERADPDTINWAKDLLQIPVIDHWWQTESGHVMIGNPWGIEKLEIKVGSPSVPIPGFEIDVLDENGNILPPNQLGSIAIKLPLAPGALPSLWKADDRFVSAYLSKFPGYYETGDAGLKDEDGYMYIMARTDDVINVAGHRLSTGAMEEILADHKDVAECAVVGISDELKGQVPLGLVCLTDGVNRPEGEVQKELVQMVRDRLGPVAFFKQALIIKRLPKTRSGKILRSTVCKIADGEEFKVPATIDDPLILEEIKEALATIGYPKN